MNIRGLTDHLIRYSTTYLVLVAFVISAFLGGWIRISLHHCPECPKCPELVARSHVERDTVIYHDTIRVVKYAPSISVKTTPSLDTSHRPVVTWDVVDTMIDRAVIGVSVSSALLPMPIPLDVTHAVRYVAPPTRIRVINDTLTVQLPALKCPSRLSREIVICGIGVGVGVAATVGYFTLK